MIWISPFFASLQADFGYDVSDYTDIAPEYGTKEFPIEATEPIFKLSKESQLNGKRIHLGGYDGVVLKMSS